MGTAGCTTGAAPPLALARCALLAFLVPLGASHGLCLGGEAGSCRALLVGGMPGAPIYERRYRDWLKRFHALLTGPAKVPAQNAVVLSGDAGFSDPIVSGKATADRIKGALGDLARKLEPQDQFILVLIGHGAAVGNLPSFIIPGQDLSAQELADALEPIRARNQVVLNLTASSGDALACFATEGRVNIAATSPTEVTEPVLAEFFLRGIESQRADGEGTPTAGNLDGTIALLEAFNWATRQTAMWIARQKASRSGWQLDGKESVEIFNKLYVGKEGEPATRTLSPASRADAPDEPIGLRPTGGTIDAFWFGRRIVAEHALLEDCGREKGVSALRTGGYQPISGLKEGEPGHLARRVVLGRPSLMPK